MDAKTVTTVEKSVSGLLEPAAHAAERAVNKATGRDTADTLLTPQGFSVGKAIETGSNALSLGSLLALPVLGTVASWKFWHKKPFQKVGITNLMGATTKLVEVNEVPVAQFGAATREAFHGAADHLPFARPVFNVAGNAVEKAHNGVAHFANATLGKTSFGSKALNSVAHTSVSNAVFGGTLIAGEGANMAMTSARRIRVLRQMQADITGGPPPSGLSVVMGTNLHPLVMKARKELISGKAGAGLLIQVGGVVGNIYLFAKNASIMKQLGFGLGSAMVGNMLAGGDTALSAYDTLHQRFVTTGRAGLEDYVGVVGGLSKNAPDKSVRAFAQQCFDDQVKPPELLRRIMTFQKSHFKMPETVQPAKAPMPTIGKHTEKVNARRVAQGVAEAGLLASSLGS